MKYENTKIKLHSETVYFLIYFKSKIGNRVQTATNQKHNYQEIFHPENKTEGTMAGISNIGNNNPGGHSVVIRGWRLACRRVSHAYINILCFIFTDGLLADGANRFQRFSPAGLAG